MMIFIYQDKNKSESYTCDVWAGSSFQYKTKKKRLINSNKCCWIENYSIFQFKFKMFAKYAHSNFYILAYTVKGSIRYLKETVKSFVQALTIRTEHQGQKSRDLFVRKKPVEEKTSSPNGGTPLIILNKSHQDLNLYYRGSRGNRSKL